MRYCRRFFLAVFVISLIFRVSLSFADDSGFNLIFSESEAEINYSQNIYNEIGTLKITSNNNPFDTNKNVVVTVQYDGKFINSQNSAQTVDYNLVLGTADSYEILNSGDKINFSATSIDAQEGLTIGAVITSGASENSDGDYGNDVNFNAVSLPVVGAKEYKFGKYPSGTDLNWRVLSVDDTNKCALLLTENCVEKMKYAKNNSSSNSWLNSGVRTWLNGTFLTALEIDKNKILSVDIQDGDNSDSSIIIKSPGTDKVFLLSLIDVKEYFNYDEDKSSCIAMLQSEAQATFWWLRTPTDNTTNVKVVNKEGAIVSDGRAANDDRYILGVRPALWLDLSSEPEQNLTSTISFTKATPNDENNNNNAKTIEIITPPVDLITEDLKNISEEELKEKFENTSSVILSGDLSNFSGKDFADLIEKIENITEVKSLDLSNVTGLTEILLPKDTNIQEINIKNNSTLISVDVSNSPLKKLNTNGCENLTSLNCSSCSIVELDIKGCENLSYLNCSYNSLTRLDLSDFQKLNKLECEHQNISGVNRVTDFNFIDFLFMQNSEKFLIADKNLNELKKIKNLEAFNKNGEVISLNLDKNTGDISFSEEPAIIKYNYQTNFEKILMDVTVATTDNNDVIESKNNDSNTLSTGCTSWGGVTFFALFGFLRCFIHRLR